MEVRVSKVEFRLLGPVEVGCDGRPVPLGGLRHQALASAQLLDANRVVFVDQLVAAAWGDEPPGTARVQAQNGISRLRHAPASTGTPDLIATSGGGYRIQDEPDQLDVHRFEALTADADARLAAGDLDRTGPGRRTPSAAGPVPTRGSAATTRRSSTSSAPCACSPRPATRSARPTPIAD
jgi:hypothetical protein